jgi:hypothetical protein
MTHLIIYELYRIRLSISLYISVSITYYLTPDYILYLIKEPLTLSTQPDILASRSIDGRHRRREMNIEDIGSWVLDATPGSKDSINAHNALYDKMEEVGLGDDLVEYSHGATEKEYVAWAIRNYNSRAA